MEKEALLRVQTIQFNRIELENENGPFMRHLWTVVGHRPFAPGSAPPATAEMEQVLLVLSDEQLAQVRAWLLQQPLPDLDQLPPAPPAQ